MDNEQYYLTLVAEECVEIAQVCSKAIRFGIDNYPHDNPKLTNRIRLKEEVNDLLAVLDALDEECNIRTERDGHLVYQKRIKMEKYKKCSIEEGKLII